MNQQFFLFVCTLLLLFTFNIKAQNLVINPSFESIATCPDDFEQIENSLMWTSPTAATADYFHECDQSNTVGIPANGVGFQSARTGSAYAGIQVYSTSSSNIDYREYIQTPLISPLIADSTYQVSMYVSPADNLDDCFTDAIGVYFSDMQLNEAQETVLSVTPKVQNMTGNFLTDKGNWLLITGTFVAAGEENHLIIGNFLNDVQTEEFADCGDDAAAYYYVEDVSVELIPELSIIGDDFICSGETTVLQGVNGSSYEWTASDAPNTVFSTDEFVSVSPSATTIYTVSDGTNSATFTLTVQQKPEINLTDEAFVCEGASLVLDATPTNTTEPVEFTWIDSSTNPTLEVETGGTYWVDVRFNSCIFRDSITLDFVPDFDLNLATRIGICEGVTTPLDAFQNSVVIDEDANFLWQDGSTNQILEVSEAGTYSVTVSNECFSKSDEIEVEVLLCGCTVSFPSAFSPNEDGINDTFRPASNCNLTDYKLSIYTRYGNEIFTSTDQTVGWDGVVDFEGADMKVYVWHASYTTLTEGNAPTIGESQSGSVFLLR